MFPNLIQFGEPGSEGLVPEAGRLVNGRSLVYPLIQSGQKIQQFLYSLSQQKHSSDGSRQMLFQLNQHTCESRCIFIVLLWTRFPESYGPVLVPTAPSSDVKTAKCH